MAEQTGRRLGNGAVPAVGVLERLGHGPRFHRQLPGHDLTAGAVHRNQVTLVDHGTVAPRHLAPGEVDVQVGRAGDARATHATGDHGGVGRHSAARGHDGDGRDHAGQVVRAGLRAHEHHTPSLRGPLHRRPGVEGYLTNGSAGARRQAAGQQHPAG
jgi:hypothetical protein